MDIPSVDLININLDDVNFDEDDPETIIHVILIAWCNRFKQSKAFKKDLRKELMAVAWHQTRWWNWCISEDEKKEKESIFTDKSFKKLGNGKELAKLDQGGGKY